MLRERAGATELDLELPDGASVAQALETVGWLTDGVPVVMAVNREYAEPTATLHADDELALIPPVSGGALTRCPCTSAPSPSPSTGWFRLSATRAPALS